MESDCYWLQSFIWGAENPPELILSLVQIGSKKELVLKLIVMMVIQSCEYIKNNWMVHFNGWMVWDVDYNLNKVIKRLVATTHCGYGEAMLLDCGIAQDALNDRKPHTK